MWGDPPVLGSVILVGVVLLVVGEEVVQLDTLAEVLLGLKTSDMLHHVKVTVNVHAGPNKSVPMDTLDLDVGVVLLPLPGDRLNEVNVRPLDSVHVLTCHLKLIEVVVLWEDLHIYFNDYINQKCCPFSHL